VLDLSFSVAWSVSASASDEEAAAPVPSPVDAAPIHTSVCPVLRWIAGQHSGLSILIKDSVLLSAATAAARSDAPTADIKSAKELPPAHLWSFLSTLKAHSALPGYGDAFMADPDCVSLYLGAIGVGKGGAGVALTEPSANALLDPAAALLKPLAALFRASGAAAEAVRLAACVSGTVDRLLLQLGRVEGFEPRNPEWVLAFENPEEVVRRQEEKERRAAAAKAGEEGRKKGGKYWAKGTGYGHDSAGSSSAVDTAAQKRKEAARALATTSLFDAILAFLQPLASGVPVPADLGHRLACSCLVPVLSGYLRSTEVDIFSKPHLYKTVYGVIRALAAVPQLVFLLDTLPDQSFTVAGLLEEQSAVARDFFQMELAGDAAAGGDGLPSGPPKLARSNSRSTSASSEEVDTMQALVNLTKAVSAAVQAHKERAAAEAAAKRAADGDAGAAPDAAAAAASGGSLSDIYVRTLREMVMGRVNMDEDGRGYAAHKFRSDIAAGMSQNSRNCLARVNKEIRSMKAALPVEFNSSIIFRYDKTRPYVMQAVIFPSENTPYDSGAFQFDIYCPPTYPQAPPMVNIMTTGGGQVRFNPNLYNTGKVCLSLLGTWRGGGKSEEWNDKSSLLQVLVSIQALIFVEFPFFNEPGYESQIGTPEGDRNRRVGDNGGYERLRVWTIQWAMVDQLRNPSKGFEEAIREHFRLKRAHILRTTAKWLEEAKESDTSGHYESLKTQRDALVVELGKLGPSPCDVEPEEAKAAPPPPVEEPAIPPEMADKVAQLAGMFPDVAPPVLVEALKNTTSVEAAVDWLFSNAS